MAHNSAGEDVATPALSGRWSSEIVGVVWIKTELRTGAHPEYQRGQPFVGFPVGQRMLFNAPPPTVSYGEASRRNCHIRELVLWLLSGVGRGSRLS